MSGIRLYIVLLLILVITIYCGQCCGPAEIGQPFTITSTANVSSGARVLWEIEAAATLYDSRLSQPDAYPDIYIGNSKQIIIKNVTKNDGTATFLHSVDWRLVYTCALPIYKRASPPTCEAVTLIGKQIRTTCTTAQVYPKAKCQFTLQNGEIDRRDITDGATYIAFSHTDPQPEGNEYYSTSCTLQYPVDGFKPGNWTVQVNMYPDLTGVSLAQGTIGQTDNTLRLAVPTVNIEPDSCPEGLTGEDDTNVRNGYIRQGEQASCLCTRAHPGNPSGTIGWSSTQGGNFVNVSQSAFAATMQINSPGTFTCQSTTVLNGSNFLTYTPKYAYGPNNALVTFQRNGPIFLCPNQQSNITITCRVPTNSFNPAPLFKITDGNRNNVVTKVAGDNAWSKSVNYNFNKSGQHIFTCRAENAIFRDIYSEASARTIQVYAPPHSSPSFAVTGQVVIRDNSGIWVKQGSDISVSCLAGEAYPLVHSVTVTCGQETSSSGPVSVSSVSGIQLDCQCAVDHETKTPCNGFNLNKEITIQTAYGPSEVKVSLADDQLREVSNMPLNLCSSGGLDVTVICALKQFDVQAGLTNDSFTLTKNETFTTTQESYLDTAGAGYYRFVNNLRVTSGGSHTLVCQARNSKFSEIKKTQSMTIEVREPPSDPPKLSARSNQHGDVLVEGDDVTVTCAVSGGYPSVQSVTLTCIQDQFVTSNETSAALTLKEIDLSYNETNCTCQATHVTGCYDMYGVLSLIVLMSNQTLSEEISAFTKAQLAGIVVGSLVGILVLVAVIVLMVFYMRRRKAQRKRRDTEYNHIGRPHYENVRPDDQNYMGIVTSKKGPGVPSENVNMKTENIDLNGIEPVEHDDHVYTEINDREESTKQDTEANSRKDQTEPTEPNPYTEILD